MAGMHRRKPPWRESRSALRSYSRLVGVLRLQLRGVDPAVARPLAVLNDDVSTPSGRSVLLLGAFTYFLLFSCLLGGVHVAVDSTAGERERGSLEPLLTLPVSRGALVAGKFAATAFFMAVALGIGIAAFAVAVDFLPLAEVGMDADIGLAECALAFAVLVPIAVLGAGLLNAVTAFTKSFKEAQSYTGIAMLLPTLPILVVVLNPMQPHHPDDAGAELVPAPPHNRYRQGRISRSRLFRRFRRQHHGHRRIVWPTGDVALSQREAVAVGSRARCRSLRRRVPCGLVASLQHLNIHIHEAVLIHGSSGKLDYQVRKLDLIRMSDDVLVIHQQDQIAYSQRRAFVRIVEWMSDRKRVHREGGDLRDSRIFELVCQICPDSSENGPDRGADSGSRHSAVSCE